MQFKTAEKITFSLLILLLCLCGDVFPKYRYKSGQVRADDPKGCAFLRCKRGQQCVERRFWCKNPPCPSMLYCSKSRKESLKGPLTCHDVRCSKGFICLVRVHRCRWGEVCERQTARCVSERDYYEGPASCVDFECPSGRRCILRESLCAKPPCKLLKSCGNAKDVKSWFEGCKILGCLSENECFLRRPEKNCQLLSCKHAPDCSAKSGEEPETNELCRGWVCPKGEECSAHTQGPCKRDSCRISRSCHKPLMVPVNSTDQHKHSWTDDVELNLYSKLEKNSSEKNSFSSLRFSNKISGGNATWNKKISIDSVDKKSREHPLYKAPIYASPNARSASSMPLSASTDITSGRVVQPTVTSLSTWLNHLELKTGVIAIEAWIKKAEKQGNYREFREWLESVKDMLGPTAYDLWLKEVRTMTVTSPAFQNWLPSVSTNRPSDLHHFVELDQDLTDIKHKGLHVYPKSQDCIKYQIDEDNKFSSQGILNAGEPKGLTKNDDFNEEDYIFPPKIDTNTTEREIALKNLIPTPPTMKFNEWPQFYPLNPKIMQRAQFPFYLNFGKTIASSNQTANPFQRFDTAGLINPRYHPVNNWSFQQLLDNNSDFLQTNPLPDQFVSPLNPEWSQIEIPMNKFPTDRGFLDLSKISAGTFPYVDETPVKSYLRNSTNDNPLWIKYFLDSYQKSQFVLPENIGSYPIPGENFGYPNWPASSFPGPSFENVLPQRSKDEDSTMDIGNFRYGNTDERRSEEILRNLAEDSGLDFQGFPWLFMDPRLRDSESLYLLDHNGRNLYDKNNREDSPILSILSETHRDDPRFPSPNRYFTDNRQEFAQSKYYWPNSYPHDRLYRIDGTRPLSSMMDLKDRFEGSRQTILKNHRKTDPFSNSNSPEINEDQPRRIFIDERVFESPGQSVEIPDTWDTKYRSPLSSNLPKFNEEQLTYRDTIGMVQPILSTVSPAVPPSSRISWPNLPVANADFSNVEDDDYRRNINNIGDYSEDESDESYPLLLSLQGYLEPLSNSIILPVYKIDDDINFEEVYKDENDDNSGEDYIIPRWSFQHKNINFPNDNIYEGRDDFPDKSQNVFNVEGATIIKNKTEKSNVAMKDNKWNYEDNASLTSNEDA